MLAYHDRSDGGLFASLVEMAFAGRCGLQVDISTLMHAATDAASVLFNEELGAVIQVNADDAPAIVAQLNQAFGATLAHEVGAVVAENEIFIAANGKNIFAILQPQLIQVT